jgi:Calcineurin-like phosphoesterase
MPNIWFTADFHLGHKNIIRYCHRPFDSVEAMNCAILERLNGAVKANDVLYFLGDFCIGPKARALELRREIRCRKIFAVPGNHDKDTSKLTQEFSWLGDLAELADRGACQDLSSSKALLLARASPRSAARETVCSCPSGRSRNPDPASECPRSQTGPPSESGRHPQDQSSGPYTSATLA